MYVCMSVCMYVCMNVCMHVPCLGYTPAFREIKARYIDR